MKTPLWDIDPFPTLVFDPDVERATRISLGLVEGGVPVEIAASAEAMLEAVGKTYFRTLVVAVGLLAAPASPPELLHRIASLQLRSRPRF